MSGSCKRILRRCWAVLAMCSVAWPAAAARDPEAHAVSDPHYGEVLYYFFQEKYFTALGHLMTAQHFQQFPHHADEAELLRGGMLLSYGAHREAGRIFEKLIASGAPASVRDRAWFYLAKIRYQRGYFDEASAALGAVGGRLPGELEAERVSLQALLLMREERYREAASLLEAFKDQSDWMRYARFNLGVALVRAGEQDRGVALLQELGRMPASTEEMKSLRDKANVALGYSFLQAGRPDQARDALEHVRLEGVLSNKALLGIGWAFSAQEDQEHAFVFWDELRKRPVHDAAVLESLLAAPYALGRLGAWQRALDQYQSAIAIYTRELKQIDDSIASIRAGHLQSTLLKDDTLEEMGWTWRLEHLPASPETDYLAQLLAENDFQEAFKNYRDLRFMSSRLDRWVDDVASYQDMVATRRQAFRERLPQASATKRSQEQARFVEQRNQFARQLAEIEWNNDADALATEREQGQIRRLEQIRRAMSRMPADSENWERYRLLRGLLRWDVETDFPGRLWDARAQLQDLDRELAITDARRTELANAREHIPDELDSFDTRIQALVPRVRDFQQRARELERAQAAYLGELAIAELTAQRDRLLTYLTQAKFAVAQIYDQSSAAPAPSTGGPETTQP